MLQMNKRPLTEQLLELAREMDLPDVDALAEFLQRPLADDERLDQALSSSGLLTEEQLLELFGRYLGIEVLSELDPTQVPVEFVTKIPATYAQHHSLVALAIEESHLTIVSGDPLGFYPSDTIAKQLGRPVKMALATRATISSTINAAYEQRLTVLEDVAGEINESSLVGLVGELASSEDLLDVVNRPPVIRLVNDIFFRALQLRASDVHVHPYEDKVLIRYRIDGLMYDMLTLPIHLLPVIVSRIKVMAGMDIAERRMPQDGRCSVKIGPREVDLRVSTVPTGYGERTVLRLLDKSTGVYSLEQLGMAQADLDKLDLTLNRTHGVFFVTGPTGSGKTTSLYSFLQRLDATERNIITIEDPIEYQLGGISQIQVASKKGMTFSSALRHVLRQDPDVIMVGEVRDEETARMVIQSSLTGHLVFSTLHTNDAPGAVTRMLDLGVEPYLVASSVIAVLAQRLVRRICPDCKEVVHADKKKFADLGLSHSAFEHVYHSEGCKNCFNTGYRGRTGIYELMLIDDNIRQCIYRHETAGAIKKVAMEGEFTTLRMDGLRKVESGETSLEEVLRVVHADEVD